MRSSTLLTGGSGRLGREIQKLMSVHAPSHQELDITEHHGSLDYDLIIHSAAFTNVGRAEVEQSACFKTNVIGTFNLVDACDCPFVFISSEYANKPVNFYALTKSIGEQIVETHPNHLIIRTLFKDRPFPYDTAYTDQYTMGDYIDVIAPLIMEAITSWNGESDLIYVGTGRKTMFELASRTRQVKPISVNDITHVRVPKDYI